MRRFNVLVTGAVVSAAITLCCAPWSAATARPGAKSGSASWKAISEQGKAVGGLDVPSVAAIGKGYEAVWVHIGGTTVNPTYGVNARLLDGAGRPIGPVHTVVSGWAGIYTEPIILKADGMRIVAVNGNKVNAAVPYGKPAEYYFTSTDGKSWTLANGSLSAGTSFDNDASVAAMGAKSIVTAVYGGDRINVNFGFSSGTPRATYDAHTDPTGNFATLPGVAATASKAWVAWDSDSSATAKTGVQVQQVYPSPGLRHQAPGSVQKGTTTSGAIHQRVPIVVSHGEPFVAYPKYDNQTVYVWKVGAKKPFAHLSSPGESNVTLAAGPQGRLWLMWVGSNGWYATRSNKADTRFGPVQHLAATPNQAPAAFSGAGDVGPLEAVSYIGNYANQNKAGIFDKQFYAKLTCSVAPGSVKPGAKVKVTVRDVTDPVLKAKVHLGSKSASTNRHGVVSLTAPKSPGTYRVTASHPQAVGCSATFHVVKKK